MAGISGFQFAELYRALQTDGPLPEDVEAWRFEEHEDYEQLGSLGVLLHKTERWPYLLTQLRKRIPPLEAYCRATQFIYSGTGEYEIIERTVRRDELGGELLRDFVSRLMADEHLPGYAGVWLQAVCQYGLSDADVKLLGLAMRDSGTVCDQRTDERLRGRRLVRHDSTGGLSEKIGLILPALLVALRRELPVGSVFVAGKQRAFVEGTWDKLKVIPGFRFAVPGDESFEILAKCVVAMVAADSGLCPLEKRLGRLAESTGTAMSPDLLAASVASKHLAIPPHSMVLDVRYGSGGLFEKFAEARAFAGRVMEMLVGANISVVADYKVAEEPNSVCIGPALEIAETAMLMRGGHPVIPFHDGLLLEQKRQVVGFFEKMMRLELGDGNWGRMADAAFADGRVLQGFRALLGAHGVAEEVVDGLVANPIGFFGLERQAAVPARDEGRLRAMDSFKLGTVAQHVADVNRGCGGIVLKKRLGDVVQVGEPIAEIWGISDDGAENAAAQLVDAFDAADR